MIRHELEQYSPALAERPELLVVTKMDLTGAEEPQGTGSPRELGREVLAISAVTGKGIPALIHAIQARLAERTDITARAVGRRARSRGHRPGRRTSSHAPDRGRPGEIPGSSGPGWTEDGRLTPSAALPPDDPLAWESLWDDWHPIPGEPSRWAIASVNPPVAQRLAAFLRGRGVRDAAWYQTAAEVPIAMDVDDAETGGADRALAVLAAREQMPPGRPGLIVSCGTAITLERGPPRGSGKGASSPRACS